MDTAMGQHDPRELGGQGSPVEFPQPEAGVLAVLVAQQGAGQHHSLLQEDRLAAQEELQVGADWR